MKLLPAAPNFCTTKRGFTRLIRNAFYPQGITGLDSQANIPFKNQVINHVYNKYDKVFVTKNGADVACARWLVGIGGGFRIVGSKQVVETAKGYRELVEAHKEENLPFVLEEIDLSDSCVMSDGMEYLSNLKHVTKIKVNFCDYLDDHGFMKLRYLRNSLLHMECVACGNLHDSALMSLRALRKLKRLHLYNFLYIGDRENVLSFLRKELPNCRVTFPRTTVLGLGYPKKPKSTPEVAGKMDNKSMGINVNVTTKKVE